METNNDRVRSWLMTGQGGHFDAGTALDRSERHRHEVLRPTAAVGARIDAQAAEAELGLG